MELSAKLKEEGCEYIIALTHMKTTSDRKLAKLGKGHIDLILGGHIHQSIFERATKKKVCLIKSGSDFQEFSTIRVNLNTKKLERRRKRILIDEKNKNFIPDPNTEVFIEKYQSKL